MVSSLDCCGCCREMVGEVAQAAVLQVPQHLGHDALVPHEEHPRPLHVVHVLRVT